MDLGSNSSESAMDEGPVSRGGKRNRGLLSCTECHRRKQKCNRRQPCNDCNLRKVPWKCHFRLPPVRGKPKLRESPRSGTEVDLIFFESMPENTTRRQRVTMVDHYFTAGPELTSPVLSDLISYLDPFTSLPYCPGWLPKAQLLHHFSNRIAPWMSENIMPHLQPQTPRICWLPEAVHHPALLYATLLAGAVHINRMIRNKYLTMAIWLKIETLRLLNESLEGADDEAIMAVIVVLFFTIDGGDFTEYEAHLRGIDQMVKLRGGLEKLGIRGQLTTWLMYYCHGPWSSDWEDGHFRYLCEL